MLLCPYTCTYVMLGVDLSAVHKGFEIGYSIRQLYPHVMFCIKATAVFSLCCRLS
jgi:hypothetical protein